MTETHDARQAALAHLIDHAPLFPPASLSVPDAIAEDRRARADEHAWLLARLVWPASQLDELEGEDRGSRSCSTRRLAATSGSRRSRRWEAGLDGLVGEAYVELPLGDGLEEKVDALAGRGLRAKVRWRRGGADRRGARPLPRRLPGGGCRSRPPPASTIRSPPTGGTASST